jgi:hypothetical protein
MTRKMYDSTNIADIPAAATMIAPYVDGSYANDAAAGRRFPKARLVLITVTGGTLNAHVVDIETGDCSPQSGVAWVGRRVAAGYHGTPYCNLSTLPEVLHEIDRQKLSRSTPIWTAHPTGTPHRQAGISLPFTPNVVATQYAWPDHGHSGGHYDISQVVDYWPGVDPAPPAPPLSVPWWWHRTIRKGDTGVDVLACKRRMRRLGYPQVSLSPRFGDALDGVIRHFQHTRGLPITGVVDRPTAHAIRTAKR